MLKTSSFSLAPPLLCTPAASTIFPFLSAIHRMDEVGKDKAIASFSTRYDREDVGATLKWLDWLKLTHPSMYVYLHPQAA